MSLVVVGPGLAPIVEHMCYPICPIILWTITWSWVNSGGAQSRGARSGHTTPSPGILTSELPGCHARPKPGGDYDHTPPAYVLFPFADPFDSEDLSSTPRFPPGFAPIRPPGSLPAQSVIVDTMCWDFSSMLLPLSWINSEPLSTGPAQPIVRETGAVRSTWSPPSHIAPVVSLVEPDLTVRTTPLVPDDPEVCSPVLVSLTGRFGSPVIIAQFAAVGQVLLLCHF